MPKSLILVDSSSYFRLARSIHPLLGRTFGEEKFMLQVLPELEAEYFQSSRLKSKFNWVDDQQYRLNRANSRIVAAKRKTEIGIAVGFVRRHCATNAIGLSSVDVAHVAHGYVCEATILTDDEQMIVVAESHGVETIKTVHLLALMLRCGRIDMVKVREVAQYLEFDRDLPRNFRADYEATFGEAFPAAK